MIGGDGRKRPTPFNKTSHQLWSLPKRSALQVKWPATRVGFRTGVYVSVQRFWFIIILNFNQCPIMDVSWHFDVPSVLSHCWKQLCRVHLSFRNLPRNRVLSLVLAALGGVPDGVRVRQCLCLWQTQTNDRHLSQALTKKERAGGFLCSPSYSPTCS